MAGVVGEHRERRAVGAIDAQHGYGGVHGRGGDARGIAFEPAHGAIGIHAQAVVSDVNAPVPTPMRAGCNRARGLRDGAPILSSAACSQAGGASRYSSRITGALCVCDAATSRHEIRSTVWPPRAGAPAIPGPKLRPRSSVTSASRRGAPPDRLQHQHARVQRIQRAGGGLTPVFVAPHLLARRRRDVHPRHARPQRAAPQRPSGSPATRRCQDQCHGADRSRPPGRLAGQIGLIPLAKKGSRGNPCRPPCESVVTEPGPQTRK
jgi:hypothetical protein